MLESVEWVRSRFLLCCSVVPVWGIDYSGTDRRTHRRKSNMSPSLSLSPPPPFIHRSSRVFLKFALTLTDIASVRSTLAFYTLHTPVGEPARKVNRERNEIAFAYFVFKKKKKKTHLLMSSPPASLWLKCRHQTFPFHSFISKWIGCKKMLCAGSFFFGYFVFFFSLSFIR